MSTHTETIHGDAAAHAHDAAGEAKVYLKTLITLLILTALTVGAAGIHFGSGSANIVIALSIASIKATLVVLFFMHIRHDRPLNGLIAATGFLFLGIFMMFTLIDVDNRESWQPVNLKAPAVAAPVPVTTPDSSGNAVPATPAAPAAK